MTKPLRPDARRRSHHGDSGLLDFESMGEPLLPLRAFYFRMFRSTLATVTLISVSLAIGTVGYHAIAHLGWLDAMLNATMILTGMGPVDRLYTTGAKLFAAGYAIFSGVAFLTSVGVFIAPVAHRLVHQFHLDETDDASPS